MLNENEMLKIGSSNSYAVAIQPQGSVTSLLGFLEAKVEILATYLQERAIISLTDTCTPGPMNEQLDRGGQFI